MNSGNQGAQSGYNNFVNSLGAVALAVALTASAFAAPTDPIKFVQANCNACHNASVASGGIDFTALSAGSKTFSSDREVWERALTKLKAGEMPPPGLPKPSAA